MTSDTPRTNAAILTEPYQIKELPFEVVKASKMAELEREINDLSQKIERFEDEFMQINSHCVRVFPNGNGKKLADLVKKGFEELNTLRWIPLTERLPTIEDGNGFEDVEWSDGHEIWQGNYKNSRKHRPTHWRSITLP